MFPAYATKLFASRSSLSEPRVVYFHPRRSNAALLAENDMFERFICRVDPQDLLSQSGEDSLEAAGASQLEGGVSATQ